MIVKPHPNLLWNRTNPRNLVMRFYKAEADKERSLSTKRFVLFINTLKHQTVMRVERSPIIAARYEAASFSHCSRSGLRSRKGTQVGIMSRQVCRFKANTLHSFHLIWRQGRLSSTVQPYQMDLVRTKLIKRRWRPTEILAEWRRYQKAAASRRGASLCLPTWKVMLAGLPSSLLSLNKPANL